MKEQAIKLLNDLGVEYAELQMHICDGVYINLDHYTISL